MTTKSIPKEIKEQAEEIITEFNRKTFRRDDVGYQARFRGRFLYLDRLQYGQVSQICRLIYTGEMKGWEFAIFKYSDESYDPDEWLFPGGEEVDGTIVGAMKAGMKAYPF